jgi:two-component system, NtrC family, sensor histidine kinase HydH
LSRPGQEAPPRRKLGWLPARDYLILDLDVKTILANALGLDAGQLATEEKRELLARLLSRLAHEIRNPLSSLDIHVQLLAEDLAPLPDELRQSAEERIELLRGEIHRLETIVQQFIRLAGSSELDLQPVNLNRVAKHVRDLLEPEAAQRHIRFHLLLPETPVPLVADPGQVTQALINLVINAIQAVGQKGRVGLRVQTDPEGSAVLLEVTDSGPGIPPERLAAIFEPFFTTKDDGRGLGLWIVHQIVSAHRGTVLAANLPEGGATFQVRLPMPPLASSHG